MEDGAGLFYDVNNFTSRASEGDIFHSPDLRLPEYLLYFWPFFFISLEVSFVNQNKIAWLAASFWVVFIIPFFIFMLALTPHLYITQHYVCYTYTDTLSDGWGCLGLFFFSFSLVLLNNKDG